jgi:hypothetical protein
MTCAACLGPAEDNTHTRPDLRRLTFTARADKRPTRESLAINPGNGVLMSRQERYENVLNWSKKIRKGLGRDSSGEKRKVIRPPLHVAFTGFAVWQCAKGAFVITASGETDGKPIFGNPKRHAHIARYSDFASAWGCALKVGPHGLVIYAEPRGAVFVVG